MVKKKRVLVAVGGTGGHIFPAVSFAKAIAKEIPDIELLFVGGGLDNNPYFERDSFSYHSISAGGIFSRSISKAIKGVVDLGRGITESYSIVKNFDPHLTVGFGSYHSFPVLLSSKLLSVPMVLHDSNSVPGKVNRFFSKKALVTGVYFPQSIIHLRGKAEIVEMQLRDGYRKSSVDRNLAFRYFNLSQDLPVILVFGGSQGAKFINQLMIRTLPLFNRKPFFQVLHFTGDSLSTAVLKQHYREYNIPAVVRDFESHMDYAWAIADFAITRSGSGTIAEAVEFEVPALFIPYPYAADKHQFHNATFVASAIGGAHVQSEGSVTSASLCQLITNLLITDKQHLETMKSSLKKYKDENSLIDFPQLVSKILGTL